MSHLKNHVLAWLILTSFIIAQPKICGRIGIGYSTPDYKSFAEGSFPSLGTMESMMFNFTASYQFYQNARVGFSQWTASTSDKYSGSDFSRSFNYRSIYIETFFFPMKQFEMNFTIGPLINSGSIQLTTSDSDDVWGELLTEFENANVDISTTAEMTTLFFGITSSVGLRYYFRPNMGFEAQIGFMENYYDKSNWTFQDESVTGPDIKIKDLPLYSFGLVYGI